MFLTCVVYIVCWNSVTQLLVHSVQFKTNRKQTVCQKTIKQKTNDKNRHTSTCQTAFNQGPLKSSAYSFITLPPNLPQRGSDCLGSRFIIDFVKQKHSVPNVALCNNCAPKKCFTFCSIANTPQRDLFVTVTCCKEQKYFLMKDKENWEEKTSISVNNST
jgi:hypothetical protein